MQLMSWKVRFEDIRFTKRNIKSLSSSKVNISKVSKWLIILDNGKSPKLHCQ